MKDENQTNQASQELKEAQDLQWKLKYDELQKQYDLLNETLKTKDQTISEYQSLNQKLFLQISAPIDSTPQESEEDVKRKALEEKIAQINAEVEAKNQQILSNNKGDK